MTKEQVKALENCPSCACSQCENYDTCRECLDCGMWAVSTNCSGFKRRKILILARTRHETSHFTRDGRSKTCVYIDSTEKIRGQAKATLVLMGRFWERDDSLDIIAYAKSRNWDIETWEEGWV